MPGNRKKPIDGTIEIVFGELHAGGNAAGLTVAQTRKLLLDTVPEFASLPPDAVARIVTSDPSADAWKHVSGEEEKMLVMLEASWGVQMIEGMAKTVPDDYVIREADFYLEFRARGT